MKHKFKKCRGLAYIVIAFCEHCGIEREGTKATGYTYITKHLNPTSGRYRNSHSDVAPACREEKQKPDA